MGNRTYISEPSDEYYMVTPNCVNSGVIIEIGDKRANQSRILLSKKEALNLIEQLEDAISSISPPKLT